MKTYRITVKGKVQGVFYRSSTLQKAKELNLKGNVRNLDDGNVMIITQGMQENINEFLSWCKLGPRMAKVSEVIFEEIEFRNFIDFKIEV